jgi:Ca2+-binding RTX toxin-like protein
MKDDHAKKNGSMAACDPALGIGGRRTALKYGLGVLAGIWFAPAKAEAPYTPIIIDHPIPQAQARFGSAVAGAGDVNGDGIPDILVGARGLVFVFSGVDGSLLLTIGNPVPGPYNGIGGAVAGVGDVNGDGKSDLLLGEMDNGKGQAYVFNGADGTLLYSLSPPVPQFSTAFGVTVAGVGDVNGDGKPDLLVGSLGWYDWNEWTGGAYVFSGADGSLLYTLHSPTPLDSVFFGEYVAGVGDVDGDGVPDLLVGEEDTYDDRWRPVSVFSGVDGRLLYTVANPTLQKAGNFGQSLAALGDVDGDGRSDLLIGARGQYIGGNQEQGQAFVFSGADGRLLYSLDAPTPEPRLFFGGAASGLGDASGDGIPDLLIGTDGGPGQVFMFSGADGTLLHTFDSTEPGVVGGSRVAGIGDVNGDGQPDFVAAWPHQDVDGNEHQGRVVLFVSATTTPPTPTCFGVPATIIGTPGNNTLRGTPGNDVIVGLAGDDIIDGLGGDDLICGGEGNDRLRGSEGNDKISGGPGNDAIWGGAGHDLLEGDAGDDRINGGKGNDIVRGGDGDDVLVVAGSGVDTVDGGPHVRRDHCAASREDTVQNCNP